MLTNKKMFEWIFIAILVMVSIVNGVYAFVVGSMLVGVITLLGILAVSLYAYLVYANKKLVISINFEDFE